MGVFVPVIIVPTQLTKVKTEVSFTAQDPWNANRPCTFTLDNYVVTLRGVKTVPQTTKASRWRGGFHRALRSEADGVTRFLPESLIELWLTNQVSVEALPALLQQLEPSLRKSDYKPVLRNLSMKIFGIFEAICCGLLMIIVIIAVVAAHASWWLAAAIVLAAACVCWVFLYQVYFGLLLRRKRQIRWLLGRIHAASSQMPTTPAAPKQPPRKFVSSIFPADTDALVLLNKLRAAFPELAWQGGKRTSGAIHLAGESVLRALSDSREEPSGIGVHLLCKNPPGPFTLTIRLEPDAGPAEADALKARVVNALVAEFPFSPPLPDSFPPPPREPLISPQPMPLATLIHSRTPDGKEIKLHLSPLPQGQETAEPGAPHSFRFDSIMNVPDVIAPSMERRLRRAFPELEWEDQAENWDKVRIWGTRREAPDRVVVSIVRKEPPGPFKLGIVVNAHDQAEAAKSLHEIIDRMKRALTGWSIFNLPQFKTRPPSGINIDQHETVDLVFPVERPEVRLLGPNGLVISLSRNLLEALSTHGEMLDSRAKEPAKYPASNDEESRLAAMRGARARAILQQAVPSGSGDHLEVQLDLLRKSQFVVSLVGELLENGWAEVLVGRLPCRRIQVHYFGSRAAPTVGFGFISYTSADATVAYPGEILHLNWWVS